MPREGSRVRKRKFYGNRFRDSAKKARLENDSVVPSTSTSVGDSTLNISASARKIGNPCPLNAPPVKATVTGYRFIDMEMLNDVFQQMVCSECGSSCCLVLEDDPRERKGSASHLRVRCQTCGWVYTFYTSKKVQHSFDINKRFVYAMRSMGQGHSSMKRFCGLMNMPPPLHLKAYSASNAALTKAAKTVATKSMKDAARELHSGEDGDQIVKCGVSCDGTWQRRGHSSLNGCVTTLSIDTGKCLDVEVLTKVCHGCQKIEKESDDVKKADLLEKHNSKCKVNYQGSAPSMETEGIKRIFGRSEETRKLQYTEYYGDGDSKAYNEVENCYKDAHVEKKECVGHVQKRVGTNLRNMKKANKGIGGKGKLTNAKIDKLQNYYGIAIRSNSGDLTAMKAAVHASLFHCASSERRNLHMHCPDGPDSWCRYKQDKANKTKLYKPGEGLPDDIIALLKPIYARLSNDELLSKCLDGKTQNQNESLNCMIWNRLPKTIFVGADVLNFGTYDAVAHFNLGNKAAVNIFEELDLVPGHFFEESIGKADRLRVKKAEHRNTPEVKKRRKILRGQKKKKEDKNKEKEGTTYEAGAF